MAFRHLVEKGARNARTADIASRADHPCQASMARGAGMAPCSGWRSFCDGRQTFLYQLCHLENRSSLALAEIGGTSGVGSQERNGRKAGHSLTSASLREAWGERERFGASGRRARRTYSLGRFIKHDVVGSTGHAPHAHHDQTKPCPVEQSLDDKQRI